MSKITRPYCIKVWLTSVLLGPLIYLFFDHLTDTSASGIAMYIGFAILGSLIVSIPSFLLLWAGVSWTFSRTKFRNKRPLIAGWATILTGAPFLILFWNDDPNTGTATTAIYGWLSFLIPILAGTFYYKLPLYPDKDLTTV